MLIEILCYGAIYFSTYAVGEIGKPCSYNYECNKIGCCPLKLDEANPVCRPYAEAGEECEIPTIKTRFHLSPVEDKLCSCHPNMYCRHEKSGKNVCQYSKSCQSYKDCGHDQCCIKNRFFSGCRRLALPGERCEQGEFFKINSRKLYHGMSCPCKDDKICFARDKSKPEEFRCAFEHDVLETKEIANEALEKPVQMRNPSEFSTKYKWRLIFETNSESNDDLRATAISEYIFSTKNEPRLITKVFENESKKTPVMPQNKYYKIDDSNIRQSSQTSSKEMIMDRNRIIKDKAPEQHRVTFDQFNKLGEISEPLESDTIKQDTSLQKTLKELIAENELMSQKENEIESLGTPFDDVFSISRNTIKFTMPVSEEIKSETSVEVGMPSEKTFMNKLPWHESDDVEKSSSSESPGSKVAVKESSDKIGVSENADNIEKKKLEAEKTHEHSLSNARLKSIASKEVETIENETAKLMLDSSQENTLPQKRPLNTVLGFQSSEKLEKRKKYKSKDIKDLEIQRKLDFYAGLVKKKNKRGSDHKTDDETSRNGLLSRNKVRKQFYADSAAGNLSKNALSSIEMNNSFETMNSLNNISMEEDPREIHYPDININIKYYGNSKFFRASNDNFNDYDYKRRNPEVFSDFKNIVNKNYLDKKFKRT